MPTQLVVFDLDETITRHDTLLPYAIGFAARRKPWRLPLLATVVPSTVGFVVKRNDEGRVKEAFIKATLGGSSRSEIDSWTARFVKPLLANGSFTDAMGFMLQVSYYCDRQDHHPEWKNVYNRVWVSLSTHSAGKVTQKDRDLAKKMDEIGKLFIH